MALKRIIAREWLMFLAVFFLSPLLLASYQWVVVSVESWPSLPFWLGPVPTYHEILKDTSLNIYRMYGPPEGVEGTDRSPSPQVPEGQRYHWFEAGTTGIDFLAGSPEEAFQMYKKWNDDPKSIDPGRIRGTLVVFFAKSSEEAKEIEALFLTGKRDDPRLKGRFFESKFQEDVRAISIAEIEQAFPRAKKGETLTDGDRNALTVAGLETTWERKPLWNYLPEVMTDGRAYLNIIIIYPLFLFIRSVIWSYRILRRKTA